MTILFLNLIMLYFSVQKLFYLPRTWILRNILELFLFFNQHLVKTGEVEKEFAEILKFAQKGRISADYDEFYIASPEEARSQLENAEKFLQRVKEILQEKDFL